MYEKFSKNLNWLTSWIPIYVIIFIIVGVFSGFLNFNDLDVTPATENDYKPLMEIQNDIIDDFNNVYKYPDNEINISENQISIFMDSDECSITSYFDKQYNYLYTERKDNIDASFEIAIVLSIVCGICGGILGILLFWIICIILDFIMHNICKKSHKKPKPSKMGGDIEH